MDRRDGADEAAAGSALLFDEADSFLRDRTEADHAWEVMEVNEFLQQLGAFQGIGACTTNLMGDLDEAALRRFAPKSSVGSAPTRWSGCSRRSSVGCRASRRVERDLGALTRLAPGDFVSFSRRVRALGAEPYASHLVAMLAEEVAMKRGSPRAIGF